MNLLTRLYLIASWTMFAGCIIAWPITAMTVFKEEPQGILGLSFLALIYASIGNVIAADIRRHQEQKEA